MKKSFTYPIVFMSLLTAIFVFVLAFLDYTTAERIEFLQGTDLQKKILYVFNMEIDSEDPEVIDKAFKEKVDKEEIDNEDIYIVRENGEVKAYAFPVSGAGLWGSIKAYAGISADYSELIGIEFIEHSETPGLGGRISEPSFKEQFRGIKLEDVNDGNYIIYKPAPGGNVDAITGATLTSKSVSDFMNKDIDKFLKKRKGE